jgi:hypothetical protein
MVPGIYLAKVKNTSEIVAATVEYFDSDAGCGKMRGLYCTRYSGRKSHVSYTNPLGVRMDQFFTAWELVHQF